MSNDFLQYCSTDTGTNLESQSDYLIDADRISGNKPGVAKSALVNKALRQANYITSQIAQYLADKTGSNLVDNATPAQLLAQINASILPLTPTVTSMLSGSGTFNATYWFFIATGSATAGATYTNNGVTFTVKATVASAVRISLSGNGAPTVSGTLTKTGGTGDTTLTFYAMRAPLYMDVEMVGAGGSGAGGGAGGAGTNGDDTTFGTSLLVAGGGVGSSGTANGGAGGSSSLGTGPVGLALSGGAGSGFFQAPISFYGNGGSGGNSAFGGGGSGGGASFAGGDAAVNTGGGGGGGSTNSSSGNANGAAGGGSGGYVKARITTLLSTYSWTVGAGKSGGAAGGQTNASAGGSSGSGAIIVSEHYQ
jgi:hypothetical protein